MLPTDGDDPSGGRAASGAAIDRAGAAPPAGFWIRTAAACLDGALGFALALLLSSSLGMFFARRAVVTLRIGEPGTWWTGPLPMVLGAVGEVVYLLPFTILVAWALDPVLGASVGKQVLGLQVRGADGSHISPLRHWSRTMLLGVGAWGWTVALIAGLWQVALLSTLAGVVMVGGCLGALGPRSLALHDRLTETTVRRIPAR